MGKSMLPTAAAGAAQLPEMGAQPPAQPGAATRTAKNGAPMPQMGPQPIAQTGKEEVHRASGDSCLTPKAPQTAADDAVEQEDETGSKFAEEDTVFIFDWDDTVLPSSWVQSQG